MSMLIESVAELARPWAELYGQSAGVQSAVTFTHFAGLLAAGGFALAADRGVLRHTGRPWPERGAFLRDLGATHRPVIAGLGAVVLSGLLLLAADVEALLPSPVFWVKMGAFALLLANGLLLRRAGERAAGAALPADTAEPAPGEAGSGPGAAAERSWRALRAASLRSAGLWFAVLLLGTLLSAAA